MPMHGYNQPESLLKFLAVLNALTHGTHFFFFIQNRHLGFVIQAHAS